MPHSLDAARRVTPILSLANFTIGMGAFMVVGLLNPVSDSFGIAPATAGNLMIWYALGYAVLSPLLVSLTGSQGRRRVLTFAMLIFALSNVIAAVAPTPSILFASRILAAAGAGLITPVAAAVVAGLSPPDRQARALASVFFGLTVSQVLGVPIGSYIAFTFGWRVAFGVVVLLALPVSWLIWTRVPAGLSFAPVSLRDLGRVLINLRLMLAVFFTSFFLGSVYIVYTYVSPLLSETMGYGRDGITLILLIFGLGAVLGNLAGGQLADRVGPSRTLFVLALAQMAIMPWFSALPFDPAILIALCLIWALFGWSFMSAQQVRLIALDPASAPVLMSLNAAAIYVGAAIGSAIGAGIITYSGLTGLGIGGGLGAASAGLVLLLSGWLNQRVRT